MIPEPVSQAAPLEGSICQDCGLANPPGFRFCGGCGSRLAPQPTPAIAYPEAEAQRRQLTVMFCDLVGSTRFAVTRDPEELGKILHALLGACESIVRRFDGTLYQYVGDGIVALFGYPNAHEDDAERAVHAGLRITEELRAMRPPGLADTEQIAVRIGIATGLVVAGDRIGQGPSAFETIVGRTPIIAERLQSLAERNSVVISDVTRSVVGERFECADLGTHVLKGFPDAMRVWKVRGTRQAASRFQAARPVQQAPVMVGRQEELQWLLGLWEQANRGHGTAVLLGGDGGIGKSRLAEAVCEHIAAKPQQVLRFQCSAHYVKTALHAVTEHTTLAARIRREDAPDEKLAKLIAWLGESEHAETVALLGTLLSIPIAEASPVKTMSADQQRERLLELLLDQFRARSLDQCLLVIFEDIHWIDPTTENLLTLLLRSVSELRILAILTYRPEEYSPPWQSGPGVTYRSLAPLTLEHATALAVQVAGERLPAAVIAKIVTKCDGVPLFIEELTKAMLGSGLLGTSAPEFAIPSTLKDSLMARLDQLGPAKLIVQVASAIGHEFSLALLQAILPLPPERMRGGLHEIEQAGLIRLGTRQAEVTYVFKHALVQEQAYESMKYPTRQELHTRIARTLEDHFPQTVHDAPELVAHHWAEAGVADRAVAYWLAAGTRASERSEYGEAYARLRAGLKLVEKVSDPELRRKSEIDLCLALAPVVIISKGGANEEVAELYARALRLCEGTRESRDLFIAGWGWWRASMNHRSGRTWADKLLQLAQDLAEPGLVLQAHHCQWATLYMLGDHAECLAHVDAGLKLYDADRDSVYAGLCSGHDARVCGLGEGGLSQWILGRPQIAHRSVMAALEWAEQTGHVGSRAHAYDFALVLYRFMRDAQTVAERAEQLLAFAGEQRLHVFAARGAIFRGWARAVLHAPHEGLDEMLQGIAAAKAADTPHDFPLYFEMLAEAYGCAGRWDEGLCVVADGLEIADRRGIVYWDAELHRRRAELLRAMGERDLAEASARDALQRARSQGAKSLEIRAATTLLKIRGDDGAGRALLRALCQDAPETAESPDLADARYLLQEQVR